MKKLLTKNYKNIIIACLIIFILSCNKATNDPEYNYTITMEDVSCIEAWLKISGEMNNTLMLVRDDSIRIKFVLGSKDTVIMDEGLLPGKEYVYKLYEDRENPKLKDTRTIRTLDTTSHNFTWQTWTFGEKSTSYLNDVVIIDENDIWAVGAIYKQGETQAYNAVHWDGSKWELKKVYYNGYTWPIRSIFAFSSNEIWFDAFVKYSNGQFINLSIPEVLMGWGINKIWGSSSNDIYVVGDGGNIAHYNGTNWSKIESGTTTSINDIWGVGENKYCAVTNTFSWGDIRILKINKKNIVDSISPPPGYGIESIWTKSGKIINTAGDYMYNNKRGNWIRSNNSSKYMNRIRGTDQNDIIAGGHFGCITHYNGISWEEYNAINPESVFHSLSIKGNTVVLVGIDNPKAIIQLGKR